MPLTKKVAHSFFTQPQPSPLKNSIQDPVILNQACEDVDPRPEIKEIWIQRAEEGKNKYGTYLTPHNGRSWIRDAFDESMDLTQYLTQGLVENKQESKYNPYPLTLEEEIILHGFQNMAYQVQEMLYCKITGQSGGLPDYTTAKTNLWKMYVELFFATKSDLGACLYQKLGASESDRCFLMREFDDGCSHILYLGRSGGYDLSTIQPDDRDDLRRYVYLENMRNISKKLEDMELIDNLSMFNEYLNMMDLIDERQEMYYTFFDVEILPTGFGPITWKGIP